MLWSYTAGGLLALLVWLLVGRIRLFLRLRHVPGPFLAGWTDLWIIWAQLSGRMNFILADAVARHGIFPFSPA